jgi:hypothetical protein
MRPTRFVFSLCLLSLVACGSDSTSPGSNNCSGPLSASVNGATWCSLAPTARYTSSIVAIAGIDNSLTGSIAIGFAATAPGTYSLTFGNNNGGVATYTKNGQGWGSGVAGGSGSVTLTTLTANHVVGTFSFNAAPSNGGATGIVQVTNGQFNITF